MVIGRNPQRDRRRRALVDENRPPSSKTTAAAAERSVRRYTPAVSRVAQLCLVDLVPIRGWTLTVWHLVAATVVCGHAAIDRWEYQARHAGWTVRAPSLNLDNPHNLASWTSSVALLLGAMYAALVLTIRRHRVDDYRGRYRVWYPIVAILILAATLRGSGLSQVAGSTILHGLEHIGTTPGSLWPVGCGLITIALGARILAEVRQSRAAATTLAIAVACLISTAALSSDSTTNGWFLAESVPAIRSLLLLTASVSILLMTASYCRFVVLDTRGLVRSSATETPAQSHSSGIRRWLEMRRKTTRTADVAPMADEPPDESAPTRTGNRRAGGPSSAQSADSVTNSKRPLDVRQRRLDTRIADTPSETPSPAVAQMASRSDNSASGASDEARFENEGNLTRAERKRLRREKKRNRRAA